MESSGTLVGLMALGFLLRALFAAAELVAASMDITRRDEGEDGEDGNAPDTLWGMSRERAQGTVLVGSMLSTIGTATVAAFLLESHLPTVPWWLGGVVLGLSLSMFGELIPRGWARARVSTLARILKWPLRLFALLFFPLLAVVGAVGGLFTRVFQYPAGLHYFVTREELKSMLKEDAGEEINPLERQMLSRVLDFSETKVEEVMVPLIEVRAIARTAPLSDAIAVFVKEGLSRLPVYADRIDNMVGILYAFDVLYAEDVDAPVSTLMRRCKHVPESGSIDAVLAELQKAHIGVAIVVDEYGGAVGLISIEDILEQIVGDIEDEYDRHVRDLQQLGPDEYLINARLRVHKLAEELGIALPEGDYETVGGLILAQVGRIPRVGEIVIHGPLMFTVRKATDRAIKEVHLTVKPPVDSSRHRRTGSRTWAGGGRHR